MFTGYRRLLVFPWLPPVTRFPALTTSYTFSLGYHRLSTGQENVVYDKERNFQDKVRNVISARRSSTFPRTVRENSVNDEATVGFDDNM